MILSWLTGLLIAVLSLRVSAQYSQDTCAEGRTVIVHLFNWKWTNIADECENFLGPKGFCGVQVSPPNEHRVITSPDRPWWERYQPVSYKLDSRSGNRGEFIDMVQRCNAVNVRIYVDVVFNHMTGAGGTGIGSGGSDFNANDGSLSFSGVPFGMNDFNTCGCGDCCTGSCDIENYGDVNQVRDCRLVSLLDLKLSSDYVRQKIADFLNDCINIGVAGFRVDACKHMWPGDIQAVYDKVSQLNSDYFPSGTNPFIFNEVIDLGGEPITSEEYTHLGRVTEFKFSANIGSVFRKMDGQKLAFLSSWGEGWGFINSADSVVFVDNHDNQRGHGAGGASVLTHKDPRPYKMATVFKLAHPYGFTRIMSSYEWTEDWTGPPHNGGAINDVPIGPDGTCSGGWLCEHRWRQITNMAYFRNVVSGTGLNDWWDNDNNQIAFARGNKGFIAINNDDYDMSETLQTGLSGGTYCDVISGEVSGDSCTGTSVTVNGDGTASIYISSASEDPVIAFHEQSKIGSGGTTPPSGTTTTTPGGPTAPPPAGMARTVIFMFFQSQNGQDLFIRGGVDHPQRPGCDTDAAQCRIPISHNSLGSSSHYEKHNAWSDGDTLLDWDGPEGGQGSYSGQAASGTPAAWTSDDQGSSGYQELNTFGDHYWMIDVDMDCSQAESGWFDLKAYVTNYGSNGGWETDRDQDSTCIGTAGGSAPYNSGNHLARCGYLNVFRHNSNTCQIDNLP